MANGIQRAFRPAMLSLIGITLVAADQAIGFFEIALPDLVAIIGWSMVAIGGLMTLFRR